LKRKQTKKKPKNQEKKASINNPVKLISENQGFE
jgi:hypothetical protein